MAITSDDKDRKKRKPLCTMSGTVNYNSHYGKKYLKIELLNDLVIQINNFEYLSEK